MIRPSSPLTMLLSRHTRRREFITLLGGAVAAWPVAAHAEQRDRMRRIGVLMAYAEGDKEAQAWIAAFRDGLEKLGWMENGNVRIDYRWATADVAQIRQQAKELVAQQPELILSSGSPTTLALVHQTRTIPIVFANLVDPIGQGFVASMSKPGGNVTGFVNLEGSIIGKYLELLKEIAPHVTRVALFYNPDTATYAHIYLDPFKAAAESLGMKATTPQFRSIAELETIMAAQRANQMPGWLRCQMASTQPIACQSHRSPLDTVSLPSIQLVHLLTLAASCPTVTMSATTIDVRHHT